MCSLRSSASPGSAWTGSRSSTPRTPSSRRVSSRAVARSWACCGPGRRTSTGQTTCFSAASARSPSTAASPRWARSRRFRRCMDAFQAIVLGIVQGLTEFLPISSSGHLRIVPAFFGWEDPGAAFTAVIQLGTMAAVLLYFRADLWRIAVAWLRSLRDPEARRTVEARLGWFIILGTIPISVLGLAFNNTIEDRFRTLYLIGTALIAFGFVMLLAEHVSRRDRELDTLTGRDAAMIGAAQALALMPGVSRSGAT